MLGYCYIGHCSGTAVAWALSSFPQKRYFDFLPWKILIFGRANTSMQRRPTYGSSVFYYCIFMKSDEADSAVPSAPFYNFVLKVFFPCSKSAGINSTGGDDEV